MADCRCPAATQRSGAIAGTVTDEAGGVLPGATVTLSSAQRTLGASQETLTDERGAYQFLRLQPGTDSVTAGLQGFRPAEQQNIIVDADATARVDLALRVGNLEEGVTVTGEAPLLDGVVLQPRTDIRNLTDGSTILGWLQQLGPTCDRASSIQHGRMLKLGFQFE